ncbi:MAG: ribonuclease III [Chlorobi bacterium]|nr:ribonuclease III [Chlorobiota bacterium]
MKKLKLALNPFALFRKRAKVKGTPPARIDLRALEELIGYRPSDYTWFDKAFTHPGANRRDDRGHYYNYDRLEFLGDAVIELVVSEFLFDRFPALPEGKLSDYRSRMVSRKNLNRLGRQMGLRRYFRLPDDILGDNLEGNVLEALAGAIYKDAGYERARHFVYSRIIQPFMESGLLDRKITSYKTALKEWAQKQGKRLQFRSERQNGDNGEFFLVRLYIDGKYFTYGKSGSKKKAEEKAARYAWFKLKNAKN